MGGAVSSGRDNNELVDNLMGGGYIRTRVVERVFRVLDRADYMIPNERDQAYKDLAWRSGALHLSAPCIYSEVMEALELKPGLSFLNLGSGTGYLSGLVGLIIGSGGISHGVEIHAGVIEYSTKKLSQFQENSVTLDELDFCVPKYYCGNALCLAPLQTQYDRVYVGAGVLPKYENYFKQLIKVGGVLVMPLGETLVQVRRVSDAEWTTRQLLNVSFALLRAPSKEETAEPMKLDELVPVSLTVLCRASIRRAMLAGVCRRHPELKEPPPRRPNAARPPPRRICIPLDSNTQDPTLHELHDMREQEGGREMNALLSLVLSMGNNRVAGSLRFGDEENLDRPGNDEREWLNDEFHGSDSSSSDDGVRCRPPRPPRSRPPHAPPTEGGQPAEGPARPSAAGAANASRLVPPGVSGSMLGGRSAPGPRLGGGSTRCEARGVRRAPGAAVPGAASSGIDLNPAGRVEVNDEEEMVMKPTVAPDVPAPPGCGCTSTRPSTSGSSDDARPSTSGKSPGAELATKHAEPQAGPSGSSSGGSGASDRPSSGLDGSDNSDSPAGPRGRPGVSSGSGESGGQGREGGAAYDPFSGLSSALRRHPALRPEYSGSAGPEEGGPGAPRLRRHIHVPPSQRARDNPARAKRCLQPQRPGRRPQVQIFFGNAGTYDGDDVVLPEANDDQHNPPDVDMDGDTSSDDQEPTTSKDKKRQKLDSGIGDCTVSSSSEAQSTSAGDTDASPSASTSASASASASGSASTSANDEGVSEGSGRSSRRRGARSETSAESLRRRRSTRDARRVRLSIVMKRAIKELPLPYALKKFVNWYRCFEF